ncbi:hypothetical protein SAMN05421876_101108 [Kaistella jeonii]|nr:hypothetical protein SAMN05421876_101108 [Kaistella jeonii]VEI94711.1 Uncharacterised protein [Kaistella jeonii]
MIKTRPFSIIPKKIIVTSLICFMSISSIAQTKKTVLTAQESDPIKLG